MSDSMRIILHGRACGDEQVRGAVETLRGEGVEVEVRVTWESGDALRLAREALDEGVGRLVAGGGDGTLHKVVTAVARAGAEAPSLGVLPLGTGNDFARACGIPVADPEAALRLVAEREPVAIDVGTADDQAFVNMATGGFGTTITAGTSDELKMVLGGISYLLTGLRRFDSVKATEGRFEGPELSWAGPFLAMALGNGRFAGGGIPLTPDALLDDGVLDLVVLPELAAGERGAILGELLREGAAAIERRLVTARLPWLEVEAPAGLHVNLDGEPTEGTGFRFEVRPGALRFHLPSGAPLADSAG